MLTVSKRTLKILAAFVWLTGGIVLVLKGSSLLVEASEFRPGRGWPLLAVIAGLVAGGVKTVFIFCKSCRNNLARIDGLSQPRIWGFFRPGFFIALALMISAGATMSRLAHGHYPALIGVGALDLALGTALLVSSYEFRQRKTFTREQGVGR